MLTITPNPWVGLFIIFEVIAILVAIDVALLLSSSEGTRSRFKYIWLKRRRLIKSIGALFAFVGAVFPLLGGIHLSPARPIVRPLDNPTTGSSLVLGFTIANPSDLFPMNNVAMTCGIDLVLLSDVNGKIFGADSAAFYTGRIISIPAGSPPYNYPCDASGLIQLRSDGSISFRDTLSSSPTALRGPIKILKMCIWVGMDYRVAGITRWAFTSPIFKWPIRQGVNQWYEGPTAVDQDRPKKMPTNDPDDLQCRDSVEGPYMYIKGFEPPRLLLDITKRTSVLSAWR